MTELQMIQNQSDQIDRLISLNNWTVGIFITIIIAVIGFLGILQWRLSDKQIQSIKIDLEKSISEKYKLESVKLLEDRIDKQQRMLDKLIQDVISTTKIASIASLSSNTVDEIQFQLFMHSLSILNIYEDLAPDSLVLNEIDTMLRVFSAHGNRLKEADVEYLDLLISLIDRVASENIKSNEAYIKLKDLSTKKATPH
ncbi:MAG: hypothetical protein WAX04_11725 [Oscillospiraceae bacterium]